MRSMLVRIIDDNTLEVTVEPPIGDGGSTVTRYSVVAEPNFVDPKVHTAEEKEGVWIQVCGKQYGKEPVGGNITWTASSLSALSATHIAWSNSWQTPKTGNDSFILRDFRVINNNWTRFSYLANGLTPVNGLDSWVNFDGGFVRFEGRLDTFGTWSVLSSSCSGGENWRSVGETAQFRVGGSISHLSEYLNSNCNGYSKSILPSRADPSESPQKTRVLWLYLPQIISNSSCMLQERRYVVRPYCIVDVKRD
eukprot:g6288.t1